MYNVCQDSGVLGGFACLDPHLESQLLGFIFHSLLFLITRGVSIGLKIYDGKTKIEVLI